MEINLLIIDSLLEKFIKDYEKGLTTIHKMYFHSTDPLSVKAFLAELHDELRTGCVTFLNKNDDLEELNSYLFYIANAVAKQQASLHIKKKTEYLCPGCLFLNEKNILDFNRVFYCGTCDERIKNQPDISSLLLSETFAKHSKNGYHCKDCDRFIPHPLNNAATITCPYFDCTFVGSWLDLKKMNHPTSFSNPEKLILDASKYGSISMKDSLKSSDLTADYKFEVKEDLQKKTQLLREVILSQIDNVAYSGSEFTTVLKTTCYRAFLNLIEQSPLEMIDYLLYSSRSGGFQHKLFQEYISILEKELPYSFKKNGHIYHVKSLLDPELKFFDGISDFEAVVSFDRKITNNTKEFYIGSRKAAYTKPYYIGKLLNILEKKSKTSLMDHVEEYGFSKIQMKDIVPGTEVIVTHLRIPPHYQMGGMVYVNRLRKKIVERSTSILEKDYA